MRGSIRVDVVLLQPTELVNGMMFWKVLSMARGSVTSFRLLGSKKHQEHTRRM